MRITQARPFIQCKTFLTAAVGSAPCTSARHAYAGTGEVEGASGTADRVVGIASCKLAAGEMWNSDSFIPWLLERSGLDTESIRLRCPRGRPVENHLLVTP